MERTLEQVAVIGFELMLKLEEDGLLAGLMQYRGRTIGAKLIAAVGKSDVEPKDRRLIAMTLDYLWAHKSAGTLRPDWRELFETDGMVKELAERCAYARYWERQREKAKKQALTET